MKKQTGIDDFFWKLDADVEELNPDALTLSAALKKYPEMKKENKYIRKNGFVIEDTLVIFADKYREQTGLIAKRTNEDDIYAIDGCILDSTTDELLAYYDPESDASIKGGVFKDDGDFRWEKLTVPLEKKKYFELDKPFFYVKCSKYLDWCYILNGPEVYHLFTEGTQNRSGPNGRRISRPFLIADRKKIFYENSHVGAIVPVKEWIIQIKKFLDILRLEMEK